MASEPTTHTDPELKQRLASLYANMAKRLGIKQHPKIVFSHDAANAEEEFGKTAYYDPISKLIRVYTTKRHPTDILRSFAHELIHHWQNEHGALPTSQSGQAHYAQKDPVLRKREMEAYLLGNILFRDWQDENRYGKLNENLEVADPTMVQATIKELLFNLIKANAIRSYHRGGTSGDMDPKDYVDEITRKLELEINKFLQVVNNRGNWENQQNMISESISKAELRKLIRERIEIALAEMPRKSKLKRKRKNQGMVDVKPDTTSYADWIKQGKLRHQKELEQKDRAKLYYRIGFGYADDDHICWYWDARHKKIVAAVGGNHFDNFGNVAPYITFRGRYDLTNKNLSLTVPVDEFGQTGEYSGDVKKDVPSELLTALKQKFPNHNLYYFSHAV